MIPLLIGNASLPLFLRNRQALRLDQPNVNYDHLAERMADQGILPPKISRRV